MSERLNIEGSNSPTEQQPSPNNKSARGSNKRKGQTTISNFFSKRPQRSRPSDSSPNSHNSRVGGVSDNSASSSGAKRASTQNSSSGDALRDMPAFPGADLNIGPSKGPVSPNGSRSNKIPLKNNVRKLVIKNAKTPNSDDQRSDQPAKKYYDLTINKLKTSVESILAEQPTIYSLEDLYRGVENLCRYDKSSALWNMCHNSLSTYIKDRKTSLQIKANECEPEIEQETSVLAEDFLRTLYREWNQWTVKATLIRNIFFYLDRAYLLPSPTRKPIWETCVELFSQNILRDSRISRPLHGGLVSILAKKRSNELADMSLLSDVFRVYSSNKDDLEQARKMVVISASKFCSMHASDPTDIETFLRTMSQRIETEIEVATFLEFPESIKKKAIESIQWESINYLNRDILFTEIGTLVERGHMHLINVLYEGSITVGVYNDLSKAWYTYIVDSGVELMKEKSTRQFVPSVIEHYKKNHRVLTDGFNRHMHFDHSFRSGIEDFINSGDNSSVIAERLAKYGDELMRSGTSKMNLSETELEDQMDSIIDIYGYIRGKDVFDAFYKKDLARRLLLGRSENIELEQVMISKFKAQTGSAAVQQLETMYNDMSLSKDELTRFNNETNENKKSKLSFHVNVLTQGVWPTYPDLYVKLPNELNKRMVDFEKFYTGERKGRKLRWHHGLGNCIVKARFPCGVKELYVSELQAAVIVLFNDNNELTFNTIKDTLAIESDSAEGTLVRALQALACSKIKVLTKSPSGNDVKSDDVFKVNEGFNEKAVRIKINQIQPKKRNVEQRKEVQKEVERDRHMEVQAAIVRVMKSRKELEHVKLVEEVIKLTRNRGNLQIPEIKRNIDLLLEKEFLERVDDNTYRYI